MDQVMIDLETLGVTADAAILSIGAVRFSLDGSIDTDNPFYASVSIDSNTALDRRIDESTLIWWMSRTAEARKVFTEPKTTLETALLDLGSWFPNDAVAWSNGASFDIPMLEHAYRQIDVAAPWKFWDARCVRTWRALPGAKDVPKIEYGTAHNALDDAIAQALHVQAIYDHLFSAKPAVANKVGSKTKERV